MQREWSALSRALKGECAVDRRQNSVDLEVSRLPVERATVARNRLHPRRGQNPSTDGRVAGRVGVATEDARLPRRPVGGIEETLALPHAKLSRYSLSNSFRLIAPEVLLAAAKCHVSVWGEFSVSHAQPFGTSGTTPATPY